MSSLNIIINFIFSIIDAILFIYLLGLFKNNKNDSRFVHILLLVGISIVISSLTLLGTTPYIKVILISIILFLTTFFYEIEFHERILLVILYYFIIIISESLVTIAISSILNIDMESIEFAYKYSFLFLGVMSKFLTIIIASAIKRKFEEERVILPGALNYVLILVFLFSIIPMILLFYIAINSHSEIIQLILLLICLFILFISMGVLIIYFSANNFYISLQKQTIKSIYSKSYKKFIINAKKREESISKIWHDMNNHIKTLDKMNNLENNDYNKYVYSLKSKINGIPDQINSGNYLINTILNDKYLEAVSHNIKFYVKAISPPKLNIDDLDLSSILFNTIDNSIEACLNSDLENNYISLELYPEGNFLYYKIKNSYNSINKSNKKNYLNKKDYISKGYGLRIVKDIVDKYDGYIKINKDDKEYNATIILHLSTL